jgi:hypothetical protein
MMRTLLLRIAGLFRRRALDRRLDEELRFISTWRPRLTGAAA